MLHVTAHTYVHIPHYNTIFIANKIKIVQKKKTTAKFARVEIVGNC